MATLAEKYRPTSLSDIKSQDHVTTVLESYVRMQNMPHLLLYGPPGSGKTSTILAMARDLYGDAHLKSMVLELNGSDDRGINVIRTHIKIFSRLKNLTCPGLPKLILLDEADSLTFDAQSALRRVIEKHTNNVRFCLVCNYINKLIPALQSRCTVFRFGAVSFDKVADLLRTILEKEGIHIQDDILQEVIGLSRGDLRKALNVLDSHRSECIKDRLYFHFFGVGEERLRELQELLASDDPKKVHEELRAMQSSLRLSLENMIDAISHIALSAGRYQVLSRLADIEYLFFKSKHMFENVFIRALAFAVTGASKPQPLISER